MRTQHYFRNILVKNARPGTDYKKMSDKSKSRDFLQNNLAYNFHMFHGHENQAKIGKEELTKY